MSSDEVTGGAQADEGWGSSIGGEDVPAAEAYGSSIGGEDVPAAEAPAGEASPAAEAAADSVPELSPAEEATTLQEVAGAVRARRQALDAMPDGPRPRKPGETYKRRKVFVDWHLQVNYIGTYLAVTTLLVIGFLALNYFFGALYQRALEIHRSQPFAQDPGVVLGVTINVVLFVVLVIGMAVYAIIQSHRVAGPALRFRRALQAIHDRDYDFYLQLRRKDYLQDMAEQLNVLNEDLKAKDVVITDAVLGLDELARRRPELADDLKEVAASLGDLVLPLGEDA